MRRTCVMVCKIPKVKKSDLYRYHNSRGVSLVELLTAMTLAALLIVVVAYYINPPEQKAKARDQRRLSDISTLDRVINEYRTDNGSYPDLEDITRTSNSLPVGSSGPFENARYGWINGNFTRYNSKLPADPINDGTYFYSYRHDQFSYELNAVLEIFDDGLNSKDGGNNDDLYEVGNNLSLL